jgi:hypothetical protein
MRRSNERLTLLVMLSEVSCACAATHVAHFAVQLLSVSTPDLVMTCCLTDTADVVHGFVMGA